MKRKLYVIIAILLGGGALYFLYGLLTTRSHSPSETKAISHQGLDVHVVYGRPYKKDRLIFGDEKDGALVPYDKYWRLGANEATEITFNKNVHFADKTVQAGSYRMYAVPKAETWQISLNSELGKFGYFEPNYALDVAKVEVPVNKESEVVEQFSISFEPADSAGVIMRMVWDQTAVYVPIRADE